MFIAATKAVIEQCKAGIVGSFRAQRAAEGALDQWLTDIETALAASRAPRPTVNQIVQVE
jgi:hypothetical protein